MPDHCELVHGYDRNDQQYEDDDCDDEPHKLLDARLRVVMYMLVVSLVTELLSSEESLRPQVSILVLGAVFKTAYMCETTVYLLKTAFY